MLYKNVSESMDCAVYLVVLDGIKVAISSKYISHGMFSLHSIYDTSILYLKVTTCISKFKHFACVGDSFV